MYRHTALSCCFLPHFAIRGPPPGREVQENVTTSKHLFVLEDLYQQPFAILQILGILLTIYFARTLIDCMRQGLFAVTVSCNRGRCLELVWNGIGKQIKHLQEE